LLDVFFLSMGEPGSEENWQRLLEFAPKAKRVKDVVGIFNAHRVCATLSNTENFWVVDADAWIADQFDFSWEPDANALHWNVPETQCINIWKSTNPVNKLEYGYGGVKLFPRDPFIKKHNWEVDMSTSLSDVIVSRDFVSCETRFNTTPESAWIGAFRECAKLASLSAIKLRIRKSIEKQEAELENLLETVNTLDYSDEGKVNYLNVQRFLITERYKEETSIFTYWQEIENNNANRLAWCTKGWEKHNGPYSIMGARAGTTFGLQNSDDLKQLNLINDWKWLKEKFKNVIV
jgi:hypothetical protein